MTFIAKLLVTALKYIYVAIDSGNNNVVFKVKTLEHACTILSMYRPSIDF